MMHGQKTSSHIYVRKYHKSFIIIKVFNKTANMVTALYIKYVGYTLRLRAGTA